MGIRSDSSTFFVGASCARDPKAAKLFLVGASCARDTKAAKLFLVGASVFAGVFLVARDTKAAKLASETQRAIRFPKVSVLGFAAIFFFTFPPLNPSENFKEKKCNFFATRL